MRQKRLMGSALRCVRCRALCGRSRRRYDILLGQWTCAKMRQ